MDCPKTKESIYVNGCSDTIKTPTITSDDLSIASILEEHYRSRKIALASMKKKRALQETKVILNYFFKLHNIWQLDEQAFFEHIDEYEDYSSLKKGYTDNGSFISPFDLHITYCSSPNYIMGDVEGKCFLVPTENNYTPQISFRRFHLCRNISVLTPATYAHEIFHTELQSQRGSIKEYENIELLSYFIGLLVSYEMDELESILPLYKAAINVELIKLIKELNAYLTKKIIVDEDEILETNQYLLSIKRAYELFIIYYQGNDDIKREVIKDIQTILDGENTLEDILLKYGIGEISPSKLLKYIK